MTEEEINAGKKAVLDHCKKLTLPLARLSESRELVGIASGFFIQVNGSTYLVSAGHALQKNGWVIETTFTIEDMRIVRSVIPNSATLLKERENCIQRSAGTSPLVE